MTKLLKLKNKPFWIAAAVILIVGIAFYKQRRTEGFETMYNAVGALYYGSLKQIDDKWFGSIDQNGFTKILYASNGNQVWKNGDPRPTSTDKKYYILMNTPASLTYKLLEEVDKTAAKSFGGFVCSVVLKDNNYRDKDGNKIIDAWMNVFGMNLLKTTFYWIIGGISALVFLIIIILIMRNSGGGNSYSRVNNYSNT